MSKDATLQNLKIRRGDDWDGALDFGDGIGGALDINGAEIWLSIRDAIVRDPTATDVSHPPVVQITSPAAGGTGITVLDGAAGSALAELTSAQTRVLEKRVYVYDVQVRPATGPLAGKLRTTQEGSLHVLDDQTLSP